MSATSKRIARRFLAIGGRFVIKPDGMPDFGINFGPLLSLELPEYERRRQMRITKAAAALVDRRGAQIAAIVRQVGCTSGAWMIWERNNRWTVARDAYLSVLAQEDAGSDDDPDADQLTEKRAAAEDVLMVIPAPDADALALKFTIARRDGRDAHWWNDVLDADALRLARGGR